MKKKCTKCKEEKLLSAFYKNKAELYCYCKECTSKIVLKSCRSKKGLLAKIYSAQMSHSKLRGHKKPEYSRKELIKWALEQKIFHDIFNKWAESGYLKDNKPSIDRLNDQQGYSFENIQIVDWETNRNKSQSNVKNGIDLTTCKGVKQYTLDGKFIKEFYSMSHAFRETGLEYHTGISRACRGVQKTAHGFIWKYA